VNSIVLDVVVVGIFHVLEPASYQPVVTAVPPEPANVLPEDEVLALPIVKAVEAEVIESDPEPEAVTVTAALAAPLTFTKPMPSMKSDLLSDAVVAVPIVPEVKLPLDTVAFTTYAPVTVTSIPSSPAKSTALPAASLRVTL